LPSEPLWLEPDEVIELNRLIVTDTGEPFELLDIGLLESALGRPRNLWSYEGVDDAAALATTLLFGIARNHAFAQGNKRTAFEAALIFLANNGFAFRAGDDLMWATAVIAVVEHKMTEAEFEALLSRFVVAVDTLP
jgi:death-on-curing protein